MSRDRDILGLELPDHGELSGGAVPGKMSLAGGIGMPHESRGPVAPGKVSLSMQLGVPSVEPLPYRDQMEALFQQDFSGVSVSTGQSEALATRGARAAARGDEIAFASTRPDPALVAHELTHVVQQRKAGSVAAAAAKEHSDPSDASEREAHAVQQHVAAHGLVGPLPEISAAPSATLHLDRGRDYGDAIITADEYEKSKAKPNDLFTGPVTWSVLGDLFEIRLSRAEDAGDELVVEIIYQGTYPVDSYKMPGQVSPARNLKVKARRRHPPEARKKLPFKTQVLSRTADSLIYDLFGDGIELLVIHDQVDADGLGKFDRRTHMMGAAINGYPADPVWFDVHLPSGDGKGGPEGEREAIIARPIKLLKDDFVLRTRRHGDSDRAVVSLAHAKGEQQVLVPFPGGPSRRLGLDLLVNDGRNLQLDLDRDGKADVKLVHVVRQIPPPGRGMHGRLDLFDDLGDMPGRPHQDPFYVHEVAAYDLEGVLLGRMVQKLDGYPGAVPAPQDALQTPPPEGAAQPVGRAPGQGDSVDEVSRAIHHSGKDWELRVDGDGDRTKELLLRVIAKGPPTDTAQEFTLQIIQLSSGVSGETKFILFRQQADQLNAFGPQLVRSPDGHGYGEISLGGARMVFGRNTTDPAVPEGKVRYDFHFNLDQRWVSFTPPAEKGEHAALVKNQGNVSEVAGMLTTELELTEYKDRFRVTVQKVDTGSVQFGLSALDGPQQVGGLTARLKDVFTPRLEPRHKDWNAATYAIDWANDNFLMNISSALDPPMDPQGRPIEGVPMAAHRDHRVTVWARGGSELSRTFPVRDGRFVPVGWMSKSNENRAAAGAADAAGVLAEQAKHPHLAEFKIQIDAAIDAALNNPSAAKYIDGLHVDAWNALRTAMILISGQANSSGEVDTEQVKIARHAIEYLDEWLVNDSNLSGNSYDRAGWGHVTRTAPGEPGPYETWTGPVRNRYTNELFDMEESVIVGERKTSVSYGKAVGINLDRKHWQFAVERYGKFREGVRAWISSCYARDAKKGEKSPEAQQLDYLGKMQGELAKLDKVQSERLELDRKLDAEVATATANGVVPPEVGEAWKLLRDDMVLMVGQTSEGKSDKQLSDRTKARAATLGSWLQREAGDRVYQFGDARANAYTGETQTKDDQGQWAVSTQASATLLVTQIDAGLLQLAGQTYNRLRDGVIRWIVHKYENDPKFKNPVAAAGLSALQTQRAGKRDVVRVAALYQADDSFENMPDNEQYGYKKADFGKYKTIPLTLFVWADGGKWYIRDLSNPDKVWDPAGVAFNGEDQPPEALFKKLDHHKHLPKGYITYHLPDGSGKRIRLTSPKPWWDHVRDWAMIIGLIGLGLLAGGWALGLLAAVAVPVTIAISVSAALSIVADVAELVDAYKEGYADQELVFMNVLDIATNLVTLGTLGAGKLAMGVERAALKAEQEGAAVGWTGLKAFAGKAGTMFYKPLLRTGMALNALNLMVMSDKMLQQLEAADKIKDPVERQKVRAQLIATFAVTGAMMILSIRGDYSALAGRTPNIVLDKVNGRTVARLADVHIGKTKVDLPEGNANMHAGARWQVEEAQHQAEFGKGKAKTDAAAMAEEEGFQKRYAEWLGQKERIDAHGKVIMPADTPPPVRERVQRMADNGNLGVHEQAFATADEVALLRKEAGELHMDPSLPDWKTSVRPQLEAKLAAHIGEPRARALVSRYEAARLGGQGNVADYAAQRAKVNKVLPESEIERIKMLYENNEIHVTGDLTNPQAAVGKGTDAVEIAVVVKNDTSPDVMMAMEQRAQGHKVLPDPEFTKATGKESLKLRVKVMTEDQFFGMATASRRGQATPRYHRIDHTVGEAIDFGVPVRAQSATRYAVDSDNIVKAQQHWNDKAAGEGRASKLKYDPNTHSTYFEVHGSKVGQTIRVEAPLPPRITSAADWGESNRIVGTVVFDDVGAARGVLRKIEAGDLQSLGHSVGVHPPKDATTAGGIEFGVGELPNGRFVIVKGDIAEVDWGKLPGIKGRGHTHPDSRFNDLSPDAAGKQQPVPLTDVVNPRPTGEPPSMEAPKVHPSPPDVIYAAQHGDGYQFVATPFVVQDGLVFKPGHGPELHPSVPKDARLEWEVTRAVEVGTLGEGGPVVVRADIEGKYNGKTVSRRTMWASGPTASEKYGVLHHAEPEGLIAKEARAGATAGKPRAPGEPPPRPDLTATEIKNLQDQLTQTVEAQIAAQKLPVAQKPEVRVLPAKEFEATFSSERGRAVFRLEGDKPIIYAHPEARKLDLAGEVQHLRQMNDPKMAAEIRILHGGALQDNWKGLPASERIDHFRRKLDIEIDAAEHLLKEQPRGSAERSEVADMLQYLRRMRDELDSLTPPQITAMNAGVMPMPHYLDTPPWLFGKRRIDPARPKAPPKVDQKSMVEVTSLEGHPARSTQYNNDEVATVHQLGVSWKEHDELFSGYSGVVTRRKGAGGKNLLVVTNEESGVKHVYEIGKDTVLDAKFANAPDESIPKKKRPVVKIDAGEKFGVNPDREYRWVEVEYKDGRPPRRMEEIRSRDDKLGWSERGKSKTDRGDALERAAVAQEDARLGARVDDQGYVKYSHLPSQEGRSGIDDIIVEFHGSKDDPHAQFRLREVKDYPDKTVPYAEYTAITTNIDDNWNHIVRSVDEAVAAIKNGTPLPKGFEGMTDKQVLAIKDAVDAKRVKVEIVLGPQTHANPAGRKGGVHDQLKNAVEAKFGKGSFVDKPTQVEQKYVDAEGEAPVAPAAPAVPSSNEP